MSETTTTRPARQRKPRQAPARFCKIAREAAGDFLLLRTVHPRKPESFDLYRVECFLSEIGGRGIELTKPDGTRYHVEVQGGRQRATAPALNRTAGTSTRRQAS